jgi:hypothetical protein
LTALILFIYVSWGIFSGPFSRFLLPITLVALVGTVIESLPQKDVDNITLTVSAVIVGLFVF